MKRLFSLLTAMCLFLPACALSNSIDYMVVPARYAVWAEQWFGLEVDHEVKSSRNRDNLTETSMDDILCYADPETLEITKLSIIYTMTEASVTLTNR